MMKYIIGNWKMNGSLAANRDWFQDIRQKLNRPIADRDIAVCVPFPYLAQCQDFLQGSAVAWGAQNLSPHAEGAYTGEVSANMLQDFNCRYVIVGHSERRTLLGETDLMVGKKIQAAVNAQIVPIICVGETLVEREAGEVEKVVGAQLASIFQHVDINVWGQGKLMLAYEPLWAIGTGKTASPEQANRVHTFIHQKLISHHANAGNTPILYGGSMKADNAQALLSMPHIHGGLIGGASLQVDSFLAIAYA